MLTPLCVVTLTYHVIAQAVERPVATDAPAMTYRSPLQQNFDNYKAAPPKDTSDLDRRCRELMHEYVESFRPPEQDRKNAVAPRLLGNNGEPETTLQNYFQRQQAEKAYRAARCD
ncbi:hypothetical protein [Paraburkholderia sp. C35]|uniref:hypothetical protein n=1 Tax=Paraburkholderia sp. C35 TaxID=2126993 RepID=UPI000D69CB96|nr:hypothetical protein [Paraburkholderia sp. C35]